jgi:hypothetical protein
MMFELDGVINPSTFVQLQSAQLRHYIFIRPLMGEEDVVICMIVGYLVLFLLTFVIIERPPSPLPLVLQLLSLPKLVSFHPNFNHL